MPCVPLVMVCPTPCFATYCRLHPAFGQEPADVDAPAACVES